MNDFPPEIEKKFDEKNFDNNLLYPKLTALYKEYSNCEDKKYDHANYGFILRPDFKKFVKNYEKLKPNEKEELLYKIKIINSEKWIEKYIIHQLKSTNYTTNKISKMEEIEGLTIQPDVVQKKVKEYGLESREVVRDTKYRDLNKNTAPDIFKPIIEDVVNKINKKRKIHNQAPLGIKEAPTLDQFTQCGYGSLLTIAYTKGITLNNIFRKLGYENLYDHKKYMDLNSQSAPDFLEPVIKDVKNKLFSLEGIKLGKRQVPTLEQFIKYGHTSILSAFNKRGISISEVEEKLGYFPNNFDITIEVGKNTHWSVERICIEHTRNLECNTFIESKTSLRDNTKAPDLTIMRNEVFKSAIESKQNVIKKIKEEIKEINVDFYIGYSMKKAIRKCQRGYQGKEKMLILVPLGASKRLHQEIPRDVKIFFREHIKILNHKEFADFIGFEGKLLDEFNHVVELANSALYNSHSRMELGELASASKILLKEKYCFGNREFIKYIKDNKMTDLLYSDLQTKKKQITLDSFSYKNFPIKRIDKIKKYIDKFVDDFSLSPIVKKIAIKLVENALNNRFSIGKKNLKGIAAGAIYLCTKYFNEPINAMKIGNKINSSKIIIYRRAKDLLTQLEHKQRKELSEIIILFKNHSLESVLILNSLIKYLREQKKSLK